MVEEGKAVLIQIYTKTFLRTVKGTPNLHTLYWKMLFDERNLRDVALQIER